ncbi:MAG: Jag N-terminal domain-containing protein [Syntrophales bacterium]|jgi:spoIIIJ-associated protein|nr:Jag N-terminal domain-containing protein [Syntrophales bacterium]
MEAIDIEAKTIDEAIEKACREFQTTREKLKIEIIAEGNPGFLGFGSKKALIRAGVLHIDRELDNLINDAPPFAPVLSPAVNASPTLAPFPSPTVREKRMENKTEVKAAKKKRNPERNSPSVSSDGGCNQKRSAAKDTAPADLSDAPSPAQPEAIKALELVEGILSRMNIPARVKLQEAADMVILKIQGDGDGLLIGKGGQNLDAIQYIVNKAVHHSINDGKRIVIDTEEYRKRREESLLTTAMQTAKKVKKTRKPVTLGPMNPHDRRIIHLALKNDKALTTISRGEGEYRKIVIVPARQEQAAANDVATNLRDEE